MVTRNLSYQSKKWTPYLLAVSCFLGSIGVVGYHDALQTVLQEPAKTELVHSKKSESRIISLLAHSPITTNSFPAYLFDCHSRTWDLQHYNSKSQIAFRVMHELFLSYSWTISTSKIIYSRWHATSDDQFFSQLG